MRGPLIALSGIDGSGKTTQGARLLTRLQQDRPEAVSVKARLSALQGVFALAEDLYGYHPQVPATLREFTIACDVLVWSRDTLRPLLEAGVPVVWDRSPLCYETYARCYGADLTWPLQLLARVEQPHQADEGLDLLAQARDTYLALAAGRDDVVVLDADRSADTVAEDVWRVARPSPARVLHMAADDVQLPDLEVIQRYSLAVRGASAPRADVIAALRSDLDWLTSSAPAPSRSATTVPAKRAPAKTTAPAPPKRAPRRAPVKRSTPTSTSEA